LITTNSSVKTRLNANKTTQKKKMVKTRKKKVFKFGLPCFDEKIGGVVFGMGYIYIYIYIK
jgi:hypothetical protein